MSAQILSDLIYSRPSGRPLALDLYLLRDASVPSPVIVWVHGGAWRQGSRENPRAARMADRGYAVASISYRLSQEAIFPAQIHDCKAAVRWLRANAAQYGLDPDRVGAWGASAGGHLVALLGTSGGVDALEGTGGCEGHSSCVQAVCDYFGPSDFRRMNDLPGTMDHDAPDSPESQLIGAPIQDRPDLVAAANPITYISGGDAPFLIVHGDRDRTVLPNQSELLYVALMKAGIEATYHVVEGGGHGFRALPPERQLQLDAVVDAFFDRHLRS